MSTTLVIAVVIIAGSLALLGLSLRREGVALRQHVCAGMTTLNLGFALLTTSLIPAGPVRTLAQLVFTVAAIWFMALEWRLVRRDRRRTPSIEQ